MEKDTVKSLKAIIHELHSNPNADRAALKERFTAAIGAASPMEIAQAEQEAVEEGVPLEGVQQMCDVHLDMFIDDAHERRVDVPPGHPVSIMYDEHDTLLDTLREARSVLMPGDGSQPSAADAIGAVAKLLPVLERADLNFIKQENSFFPVMEKHGITQPPAVMWGEHDAMRDLFKRFSSSGPGNRAEAGQILLQAEEIMASHVLKEESVLFQAGMNLLSADEWAAIRQDFDELGYLHSEVPAYAAADESSASGGAANDATPEAGRITLPSGSFNTEQLLAMLNMLPVDLTLVDAQDKVAYFSESSERIFPRARSVVGRSVQNCHPPKSVHIVQEILERFRDGSRDSEEFYLHLGEKYVYIRYYALRSETGEYLGCLEVSQDIAPIQAIEGEKRIL